MLSVRVAEIIHILSRSLLSKRKLPMLLSVPFVRALNYSLPQFCPENSRLIQEMTLLVPFWSKDQPIPYALGHLF